MISGSSTSEIVKKAISEIFSSGVEAKRTVGDWCMKPEGKQEMLELHNVTLVHENPVNCWHNKINAGTMTEFLDWVLGLNPGNVHKMWDFHGKWIDKKTGRYPYTYGERIFGECDGNSGVNQWDEVARKLIRDRDTRHAGIVIWRPEDQLRDYIPCTPFYQFYFNEHEKLCLTAILRSNDIMVGGLPRNIWLNCMMLQMMSAEVRAKVGVYTQFDVNLHMYPGDREKVEKLRDTISSPECIQASVPFMKSDMSIRSSLRQIFDIEGHHGNPIDGVMNEDCRENRYWKSYLSCVAYWYLKKKNGNEEAIRDCFSDITVEEMSMIGKY